MSFRNSYKNKVRKPSKKKSPKKLEVKKSNKKERDVRLSEIKAFIAYLGSFYYHINIYLRKGREKLYNDMLCLYNQRIKSYNELLRPHLEKDEKINKYFVSKYEDDIKKVNKKIRDLNKYIDKIVLFAEKLENIFKVPKITDISDGIQVYRGVSADKSYYSSEPVLEKGFVSTSPSLDSAFSFSYDECCIYYLLIEEGIPYIDINKGNYTTLTGEKEYLLPNNLWFTRINKEEKFIFDLNYREEVERKNVEFIYVSKNKPDDKTKLPDESQFQNPKLKNKTLNLNVSDYVKILFLLNNSNDKKYHILNSDEFYNLLNNIKELKISQKISNKIYNEYLFLLENGFTLKNLFRDESISDNELDSENIDKLNIETINNAEIIQDKEEIIENLEFNT
jgi:hypothetical protein